jgi:hypothetical protein
MSLFEPVNATVFRILACATGSTIVPSEQALRDAESRAGIQAGGEPARHVAHEQILPKGQNATKQ